MKTICLFAALLLSAPAVAADLAPLPEPEAAWNHLLAEGDLERSYKLYDLVDAVEGEDVEVDLEPCKQQAAALDAALREMPAAIALWYATYRCADLRGDAPAAEHYLEGFTRLARHALAQANDDVRAPPIRLFAYPDLRALLQASGMPRLYSLMDSDRPRHLELVEAVEDKEAGRERLLRFDYLDTIVRMVRDDPDARYPGYRKHLADAMVDRLAQAGFRGARDLRATRQAADVDTLAERLAILRPAAEAGGINAAWEWINYCAKADEKGCADGLVDALLPGAEAHNAHALVLLGIVHAEGMGVERNEKYAMALLDAADARLGGSQGTVMYARYQLGLRPGKLSEGLRTRLQRAAAEGHPFAVRLLATMKYDENPAYVATDADLAPLIALDAKGATQMAATIGDMLYSAKRYAEGAPWIAKGAAAGDPQSQYRFGWLNDEGYGVPRDPAAGQRWLELAAAGGDTQAMHKLATRAGGSGDWKAAEQWLLSAMTYGDLDAALQLAFVYGEGHPGLAHKPAYGVELLEKLDKEMDRVEIRQVLSQLYGKGKGVPADPAKAHALLRKDAEANDRRSQMLLAHALATGEFGTKDMAEAERWFARAAAGGDFEALDAHAYFLFYLLDTAESRPRGLALWRSVKPGTADVDFIWNNLAWALCTGHDATLRAPEEGLAVLGRMGEVAMLPLGFRDTVAACYAAGGRLADAAKMQRAVIERVATNDASDDSLPAMRDRLALYEAGKAYVDGPRQ